MMNFRSLYPGGVVLLSAVFAWNVVVLRAQDAPRQSIEVEPSVLDTYVGQYQLAPKVLLTLRREGRYLTAQLTGQPAFPVYAENETKFFWKVVDAQFSLQKDAGGKVNGLFFEQGAQKLKASRISGELPKLAEIVELEDVFDSPRLIALAKELKEGNREALRKFWQDIQNKAPLIEPIGGDGKSSWVTFVWRGDDRTQTVGLTGGSPTQDGTKWLTRLADTDLWYRTERIPNDARFAYSFQINRPHRLPRDEDLDALAKLMEFCPNRPDPLNPRELSLQGTSLVSLLELTGAPPQPWLQRLPGVARGTLKDQKITSTALDNEERSFTIYTPANYDPNGQAYGLLVLFDGDWYQDSESVPGPTILDNLIAGKKIPPLITVFVKQPLKTRNRDLSCSESFASFLVKELVPSVRKEYHVGADPRHTIVGGLSLGGLMASYCALHHPDVFGNVLSQSGSYQWSPGELERHDKTIPDAEPGFLTREFVTTPRSDVRFFIEAGCFEDSGFANLFAENRRFRDVLLAKGYAVTWSQFNGGHDFVSWRGSFADALVALAGSDKKSN